MGCVTFRRSPPQPETSPDPFWGTLIELLLGMRGWWSALCDELHLTPSQGLALRRLDPERPLAMSTLAEALACDASNVTGIVDKLETRGLIARRGADHDRRVKTLVVTERGRALRDRLIARLLEPFQQLGSRRPNHRNGHGLGLAIVAAIATAHHASLTLRPIPDGGLSVEVRFPPLTGRTPGHQNRSPATSANGRQSSQPLPQLREV